MIYYHIPGLRKDHCCRRAGWQRRRRTSVIPRPQSSYVTRGRPENHTPNQRRRRFCMASRDFFGEPRARFTPYCTAIHYPAPHTLHLHTLHIVCLSVHYYYVRACARMHTYTTDCIFCRCRRRRCETFARFPGRHEGYERVLLA